MSAAGQFMLTDEMKARLMRAIEGKWKSEDDGPYSLAVEVANANIAGATLRLKITDRKGVPLVEMEPLFVQATCSLYVSNLASAFTIAISDR